MKRDQAGASASLVGTREEKSIFGNFISPKVYVKIKSMEILKNLDYWTLFGFFAQFIFLMRFGVQWLHSEKQKKSVIPISFWYLSIVGAIMILVYAIKRGDPVFIVGQFFALLIYIRNVMLRKISSV